MSDSIPWITSNDDSSDERSSYVVPGTGETADRGRQTNDASLQPDVCGDLLHQAVKYNNSELLESLLQAEERNYIDKLHNDDETVLFIAVTNHYIECCHILLAAGGI